MPVDQFTVVGCQSSIVAVPEMGLSAPEAAGSHLTCRLTTDD